MSRTHSTSPKVVVIDEYMAQQLWPNQDPIGQRIHYGGVTDKDPWETVVGVVGRVKQYTLDSDSRIALYLPQTQYPTRAMNVVLRSAADPAALTSAVKQQIHELDSDLPLYNVRTMEPAARRIAGAAPFLHAAVGAFRCCGSCPGDDRNLRSHGLSGESGHA